MRLAGTARQYSKKAMPQLTSTTCHSATLGNFSWPYQAKVIKTLEQNRRTMGRSAVMANTSGEHGNDTVLAAREQRRRGVRPAAYADCGISFLNSTRSEQPGRQIDHGGENGGVEAERYHRMDGADTPHGAGF